MKCLYCHETVQPEGETCPKCGLPLIEDTTLLEVGGPEKPSVADWLNERKSLLLGAAGGFVAAGAIAVIIISANASPEPRVNEALTPPPTAPAQAAPVQLASRSTVGAYNPVAAPSMPAPATLPAAPAPAAPAAVRPATPPVTVASAAPAVQQGGDISAPPPLPANFEYDPQWEFDRPPAESRRRAPQADPFPDPTPPQHTLAANPHRMRSTQYVIVVPNEYRDGITAVSNERIP